MRPLLAWFCLPVFLAAAASDDWKNLDRLKAGEEIDVVQTSMGTTSGHYRSHSADSLAIESGGAEKSFPKAAVVRVSRKDKSHRVANGVVLGFVVALVGAGAMRFGIACAETDDGCRNTKLATVFGGAAGAAIGAMLPAWPELIYRARRP